MDALNINHYVQIQHTGSPTRGLGLFASCHLTTGLKIHSEEAILVSESLEQAASKISQEVMTVQPEVRVMLLKLFAGPNDMHRPAFDSNIIMPSSASASPNRLQSIVKFNAIEGQGTGCFLSIVASSINHSYVVPKFQSVQFFGSKTNTFNQMPPQCLSLLQRHHRLSHSPCHPRYLPRRRDYCLIHPAPPRHLCYKGTAGIFAQELGVLV